jgi:phage terminase small subunit
MMTKAEVVAALLANYVPRDRAEMYAGAFLEYREATANIDKNGLIVQHPRTANPIANPYIAIRDKALAKLDKMAKVKAAFLWDSV